MVLVTLDAARPDHLSAYGYERRTSPSIEALAADGVLFRRAYSVSSWTLPTHASLLTGLYPNRHRTQFASFSGDPGEASGETGPATAVLRGFRVHVLPERLPILAELLGSAGFATGAAVGGPWLHRTFGFAMPPPFLLPSLRERVLGGGPLPNTEELSALHSGYDAEIAFSDACVGELVGGLRRLDRYRDALIVITADHGEEFGEEGGVGHNHSLSEAELRIPLIIKFPGEGAGGRTVETPVSLVDIFPTIIAAASAEFAEPRPGVPLQDLLEGSALERPLFHEVRRNPGIAAKDPGLDRDLIGLTPGRLRYLVSSAGNRRLLQVQDGGTGARAEEIAGERELMEAFERLIAVYREAEEAGSYRMARPPADVVDRLRALGYIR